MLPDQPAAKADATPQQQKIADLIKQLAADDFATRTAASNELLKLGPIVSSPARAPRE